MEEKQKPRRYTEVVASLETHIIYIGNHLKNIDSHLEKQNSSIDKHGNRLTALETIQGRSVNLSKRQAVGVGSSVFVVGGFLFGVTNAAGKYLGWW